MILPIKETPSFTSAISNSTKELMLSGAELTTFKVATIAGYQLASLIFHGHQLYQNNQKNIELIQQENQKEQPQLQTWEKDCIQQIYTHFSTKFFGEEIQKQEEFDIFIKKLTKNFQDISTKIKQLNTDSKNLKKDLQLATDQYNKIHSVQKKSTTSQEKIELDQQKIHSLLEKMGLLRSQQIQIQEEINSLTQNQQTAENKKLQSTECKKAIDTISQFVDLLKNPTENLNIAEYLDKLPISPSSLPPIPKTRMIKYLSFKGYMIGNFDFSLFPNLEKLNLRNCKITGLIDNLNQLKKLSLLDLRDNPELNFSSFLENWENKDYKPSIKVSFDEKIEEYCKKKGLIFEKQSERAIEKSSPHTWVLKQSFKEDTSSDYLIIIPKSLPTSKCQRILRYFKHLQDKNHFKKFADL